MARSHPLESGALLGLWRPVRVVVLGRPASNARACTPLLWQEIVPPACHCKTVQANYCIGGE